MLRDLGPALLHALVFFAAALWAFQLGHEVAGAWLGLLMGVQAGVFAVFWLSGLPGWLQRLRRIWLR